MIKALLKLLLGNFIALLGVITVISEGGATGWVMIAVGLLIAVFW